LGREGRRRKNKKVQGRTNRLLSFHYKLYNWCHIVPSLRLLVLSSLQAYRHFFFSERPCLWRLWSPSRMAPRCHAALDDSSEFDVQLTFLVAWDFHCSFPAAPSLGLLVFSRQSKVVKVQS
jgi:hypothetical protein